MKPELLALYLFVMAGVTYLIRAIPFTLFRKEIQSVFLQSFLHYVPYTVLGAMTFPAVFFATNNFYASLTGTLVGCVLAYFRRSLMIVALGATLAALAVQVLITYVIA